METARSPEACAIVAAGSGLSGRNSRWGFESPVRTSPKVRSDPTLPGGVIDPVTVLERYGWMLLLRSRRGRGMSIDEVEPEQGRSDEVEPEQGRSVEVEPEQGRSVEVDPRGPVDEVPAPGIGAGRVEGRWAPPIRELHVNAGGDGGDVRAVEGRQLVGPMQGFGQLWHKTYRVRLEGAAAGPAEVIDVWRSEFGSFWPTNNRFHAPLAGITPGEVALISGTIPGGLTLSTGVLVIYADDESFSYMNPEGHPWAGMITFSASEVDGATEVQVLLLIRAYDPLTEVGMLLFGHRMEDRIWEHTLRAVATRFGAPDVQVETQVVRVDARRQWEHFGNWRRSSPLYALVRPFRRRAVAGPADR
jgi:hypothetical protein